MGCRPTASCTEEMHEPVAVAIEAICSRSVSQREVVIRLQLRIADATRAVNILEVVEVILAVEVEQSLQVAVGVRHEDMLGKMFIKSHKPHT